MKAFLEKYSKSTKINGDAIALCDYKLQKSVSSKKKHSLTGFLAEINKDLKNLISESIDEENFDFSAGSTLLIKINSFIKLPAKYKSIKQIIIFGLGEKTEDNQDDLRKSIAAMIRKAKASKAEKLFVHYPAAAELVVETAILVSYEFNKYKTKKEDEKPSKKLSELRVLVDEMGVGDKKTFKNAQIIAESTCLARDLVWEPACVVTPSYLADEARKITNPGSSKSIKVTVKEAAECKRLGMGAFLAVARGSDQAPKFIEITYKPTGKIKKHIALVGKGVTFDSGGLSLKPAKAMEMMKEDMSGSAAILGIMSAIAKIQPSGLQITAVIAATENMPNGKAYKPGDVITAMNGKTIEVNNTDAEGRLTLADAVTYVSGKNPDEIIDFATLTGACMVALGNICAGLMGNDQELIERIKVSAAKQGELMWQLPLYDEYKKSLKSTIADMINAGSKGKAGAQNGGLFVGEFVGKQKGSDKAIPWAHIDIAGPCWYDQDMDWSPKGASGMPVRTILDYLFSL